eukprot:15481146-Alexandrium_andersonii.AAC.1
MRPPGLVGLTAMLAPKFLSGGSVMAVALLPAIFPCAFLPKRQGPAVDQQFSLLSCGLGNTRRFAREGRGGR